jgi:hypothetical protein
MSEIIFSAKLPHNTDYLGISNCTIEFKITNDYVSASEYVQVFNSFLRAIGLSEYSIMKAELDAALDIETNGEELVNSLMQASEIMETSDHINELCDVEEGQKQEIDRLQKQMIDLKAELSRLKGPENPQSTEEELEAMCWKGNKLWD